MHTDSVEILHAALPDGGLQPDGLDSVTALVRVIAAHRAGRLPDRADSSLLEAGVLAWLDGASTLDQSLGLAGGSPGRSGARTRYRKAVRDHHLAMAHRLCEGDSPRAQSVSLVRQVVRFQRDVWPRWRGLSEPKAGASEIRRHLFWARQAAALPESENQLHAICTRGSAGSIPQ